MRIVMFSINPLFPDKVMGGAPKHLQKIAIHLGKLGHQVEVLCTGRNDLPQQFQWAKNVLVRPVLPFKQPFPQPYDIPAYATAAILQIVGEALQRADRFYMHDGEFLFPYAYQHIPTVVSLRDNVYPETLLGGFLFQGDGLIAISEYSRQLYRHTMGRYLHGLDNRLKVIHNGLDWAHFRPVAPSKELLTRLGVDPQQHAIVLHPHRPEPSKGLENTIRVAWLLVNRFGFTNLRVLAPRWLAGASSTEVEAYHQSILTDLRQRGLEQNFVFHDWITQAEMPQFYSLGGVTLSLGTFPESFGNAVYESLGCGTPSIAARVSTHRELLPDEMLDKVHPGDDETAAARAADILHQRRRTSPETITYLHEHYGMERQLDSYARLILDAQRLGPLTYRHPSLDDDTLLVLAPWCYAWEGGIYHDFNGQHCRWPAIEELQRRYPDGFSANQAAGLGLSKTEFWEAYQRGYLSPLPSSD